MNFNISGSGMSVLCSLALRMLTQIGLQESLKIYQDNFKDGNDEKMTKIFDRTTKTGRIATIYSLNTHETFRVQDDFIKRVLMAIFLTRCLRKANFFSTESKKDELYSEFYIYIIFVIIQIDTIIKLVIVLLQKVINDVWRLSHLVLRLW